MRPARISIAFTYLLLALLLKGPQAVRAGTTVAAIECEGTACQYVSVTFDEQKQEYRVHNSSADTWARVSASNLSASAEACVAPGKDAFLPLKGITGPYRADSEGSSCGSADGT